MLRSTFSSIGRTLQRGVLLVAAGLLVASPLSLALSSQVNAAELVDSSVQVATSYAWKDRQTIAVTGGSVKANQGITVDANAAQPSSGGGFIVMTETQTIRDCTLWVFCSENEVQEECFVNLKIQFSNGLSQGTLSATIGAVAGSSNGPFACTQKTHDAYNGKVVSITGTRPADGSSTTEKPEQKTVVFVVHSNFSSSEAPDSVDLRITGTASRNLVANKGTLNGKVTFSASQQFEPGSYSVTVVNPPEGLAVSKVDFTKVKFNHLTVNIGNAEGFANRQIEVKIVISSQDPSAQRYGPYMLYLYDSEGKELATKETNSVDMQAVTEGQLNEQIINLRGTFDDVDPGTYKICIGPGNTLCQEVVKVAGDRKNVTFEVTKQELGAAIDSEGDISSCAIDGIGWLVCPVITFAASLADGMFGVLADNFLKVGVSVVNSDPANGPTTTYDAWRAMQAIANVILVIGFLFIIFSQLTGGGLSNYGVKKMLPRLIVVAILINVSFIVCQIAVDISNILGYSLRDFFGGIAEQATAGQKTTYDNSTGNILGGTNGWANLAGGVLVGVGAIAAGYFVLSALGVVLLAALLALLMILLILIARQAIIVLAIVVAPVAIALYLLPNTENLTKQWWKIFSRMLLLFPIIALLFGASTLAAVILRDSFASIVPDNQNVNWFGQIMAAGIQVLPLFATPLVLKGALNAVPVLGNLASKLAGRANAGFGKAGAEGFKNSRFGKYRQFRKTEGENRRTLIQSGAYQGRGGRLNPRNWASGLNKQVNEASGKFGSRLAASGIALADENLEKDIKAAAIRLNSQGKSRPEVRALAKDLSIDPAMRRAAVNKVVETNDIAGINELLEASHGWSQQERIHFADKLATASNRPAYIGQGDLATMRGATMAQVSVSELVKKAVRSNAYSAAKIATGDGDELTFVANEAAKAGGDVSSILSSAATVALSDERLAPTVSKNLAQVQNLAAQQPPRPEDVSKLAQ